MFSHITNVSSVDDDVSFFFQMTKLTMSSTLKLSMSAFKNILDFNSKDYNYQIPNINAQFNHLLVLSTTRTHVLSPVNYYSTSSPPTPTSVSLSPGHNESETRLMMLKMVDLPNSNTD